MSIINPANKTLLLVIGAPRSGTTLLSGLLSESHDAYPMLPECTNITQAIQHYHNFVRYADVQRFTTYAGSPDQLAVPYRQLVKDLVGIALSHFEGKSYRHLVLKDPELSLLVDEIPLFFGENAKVVCIIRDPRSVLASMQKILQKKRSRVWRRFRETPSWNSFLEYLGQYTQASSLSGVIFNYYWCVHQSDLYKRGCIHVVRYEKIIEGDVGEFDRLDAYLGYPCGRKGFGKAHLPFDTRDDTFSNNYGKAINPHHGDFRHTLSKRQVRQVERLFAGFNQMYKWWLG